jgi:PHS family inorganic phosphate transporter-like MFS transporter
MSVEVARPTPAPAQNSNRLVAGLEECEQDNRPPFILNRSELRLLGIAGIGFFLDGEQKSW